jgi:hypothetical protein
MATITLERGDFGTYKLVAADGRSALIQTDWDYPGTAATFGWAPHCEVTDGTVDCPHGVSASQMIAEARSFLDEHIGDTVEDPGYLNG